MPDTFYSPYARPVVTPPTSLERDYVGHRIISSLSHDLKTPLASIIGSLEIFEKLKESLSPDKKHLLLQNALQEARRLDGFINNILEIAKLENGLIKPHYELHNIRVLVNDCLTIHQSRLRNCLIHMVKETLDIDCYTDAPLFTRALYILLDNAAKYAQPSPVITIRCAQLSDHIDLYIEDNGPGLTENTFDALFSKYSHFDKQDYKSAGTGLGLPICKEIMLLLGGNVRIGPAAAQQNGASFILELPL